MLGGRRGLADGGWGNSVVAEVLPVQLPDLDAASFMRVPVPVELTAEGQESLVIRLDADRETNRELWQGMPDIADFQYVGAVKPGAVTLLEAQVRGTAQPLLVHQRFGRGQVYVLASGRHLAVADAVAVARTSGTRPSGGRSCTRWSRARRIRWCSPRSGLTTLTRMRSYCGRAFATAASNPSANASVRVGGIRRCDRRRSGYRRSDCRRSDCRRSDCR